MRIQSAVLLGFATLLFACAEQPTGYPPSYSSSDGPEYATPASPAYDYAPGYPALNHYGSDVFLGGGGYWAGGEEPDPGSEADHPTAVDHRGPQGQNGQPHVHGTSGFFIARLTA